MVRKHNVLAWMDELLREKRLTRFELGFIADLCATLAATAHDDDLLSDSGAQWQLVLRRAMWLLAQQKDTFSQLWLPTVKSLLHEDNKMQSDHEL